MSVLDQSSAVERSTPVAFTSTGARPSSPESALKRAVDVTGSALGLLLLLPLLVLVSLVITVSDRGPALYRQTRVGLDGREFSIVKFRTMYTNSDERLAALKATRISTGPLFKMQDDPRITRIGRILRTLSVDELPQLWNVLRGDMSLVGPRPGLPCEVDVYCTRALRRLEVVPGMTGAWQVGGRSTLAWNDALALDIHYVDHWSHRYDAVILLKTVRAVLRPVGAY